VSSSEPPSPWRPSRRARISALVLAVLLVAGVTGGILVTNHNSDAPVAVVRAYVEAIARGDAATANRLVDPRRYGDGVDPALLTDKVLRSAKQRITVGEVKLAYDADLSGDAVDVQVEYALGAKFRASMLLRVERAGTTAGVLHDWRVIDPLLVPVRVETSEPRLDTASLGAATIPVGGPSVNGWPERPVFVYPGVYELRGHESRYLTAEPDTLVATNQSYGERPADVDRQQVRGALQYQATPKLTAIVADRLTDYVTACVAAAPKVPRDCPGRIRAYADFATDLKLDRRPDIESIQSYQVDYRTERDEPSLRMLAENGRFSYRYEGERDDEGFLAYARIVVTPRDDLTITFDSVL
jgi:hypothetical protein